MGGDFAAAQALQRSNLLVSKTCDLTGDLLNTLDSFIHWGRRLQCYILSTIVAAWKERKCLLEMSMECTANQSLPGLSTETAMAHLRL